MPDVVAILLLAPLAILSLFVLIEALFALAPVRASAPTTPSAPRPRAAILIPAHNERSGIAHTLASLAPELRPHDSILVVADNCTDDTASIARAANLPNLDVLERHDTANRGKGHALNAGLARLAASPTPPEVVVFLDADCRFLPATLDPLIHAAHTLHRPAQACNLVDAPANPTPKDQLSAFAFRFKNLVRPLGLSRLGLPCLLMGTGMAMPWSIAKDINASAALTEDIKLGIDLALKGQAPKYVPHSHVRSAAPSSEKVATTQRTRWEHGHVQSILHHAPAMLAKSITHAKPSLFFLALELAVPPLSLFVLICVAAVGVTLALYLFHAISLTPLIVALATLLATALAVFLGWLAHGRSTISLLELARVPVYILWKIPIYLRLVNKPEQQWVRTERPS